MNKKKMFAAYRAASQRTVAYLWLFIGMLSLLVCSSMAWFSISASPNVADMGIFVNAPVGLQLAAVYNAPDEQWVQNLNFSDLVSEDSPLRPVTWSEQDSCFKAMRYGIDGRQTRKLKTLSDDKNANRTDDEQYYMVGEFYVRSDMSCKVSLADAVVLNSGMDGAGTYVIGRPEWNAALGAHEDAGKGAQYAIRIGFRITQVDSDTGGTVGHSRFLIYEPNADRHFDHSVRYLDTRSTDGSETLVSSERLLVQSSSSWKETTPVQKNITVKDPGEFITDKELFEITAGQILRIDLYIWVEGQDVDCYGLPEDAKLLANIQFESGSTVQSGMADIPSR